MKKLVLDLDETLLYSTVEPVVPDCVKLSAADMQFYTAFRPGLRPFLEFVRDKFEVTIWTTGMQAYVEAIWNYLDLDGFRLWGRDYCKKLDPPPQNGEPYEKPLRQITEDLTQVAIIDNMPGMFAKCPVNGILTRTWRGDPNDTELTHLSYYLEWLNTQPSMQRDHRAWRLETMCLRSK